MDNDLTFPPLDKSALVAAALSPVLNQWVVDTVAFHQARLKLAGMIEPGQPVLTLDGCRAQAEEFRDLVLRQVQEGIFPVSMPFDGKVLAPVGALSTFPFESLQRLSELQSLGLLPCIRLVWPPELVHLDKWGTQGPRTRHIDAILLSALDQDGDWGTDDSDDSDDDGPSPTPTPTSGRKRRGPGDKCAIS